MAMKGFCFNKVFAILRFVLFSPINLWNSNSIKKSGVSRPGTAANMVHRTSTYSLVFWRYAIIGPPNSTTEE